VARAAEEPRRRAVFLDRDGVLNRVRLVDGRPHPPRTPAELELLPGVDSACRTLHDAGWLLVVVTNQPDVARGATSRAEVEALNAALARRLPLDDVRVCFHDDADDCACRKPRPGLLRDAARTWNVELPASVMVGDRWRDVDAGREAGCRTVFVDHGYDERRPAAVDLTVGSLAEAVPWILGTHRDSEAR
jgi:D-glycero-D-manno-heptose 1,7-bisphosphate phosphatase